MGVVDEVCVGQIANASQCFSQVLMQQGWADVELTFILMPLSLRAIVRLILSFSRPPFVNTGPISPVMTERVSFAASRTIELLSPSA